MSAIQESTKVNNKKFWLYSGLAILAFVLGSLASQAFSAPGGLGNPWASNEQVRSAYNVDIINNPNFTGKDMLKVNDEKLAEFCVRPTVKEVEEKKPLDCKVA